MVFGRSLGISFPSTFRHAHAFTAGNINGVLTDQTMGASKEMFTGMALID
jgi:hypothetical protein